VIVANKIDLATDTAALKRLREELGQEVLGISGATHAGTRDLLEALWRKLHPAAE
jgi:50S ribosomal subunit-associated GTPase HflX